MAVERSPSGSSLIDVLDRVLDKGIVIDAWVRVSLVGIDLVTVEAAFGVDGGMAAFGACVLNRGSVRHQSIPICSALSIEQMSSRTWIVRSSTFARLILMSPTTTSPLSSTRSRTSTRP